MLLEPIQTRSTPSLRARSTVEDRRSGVDAGRDDPDLIGPSPAFKGAIGQEGIAGDHGVSSADGALKSPRAAAMVRPPRVVGVAIEDRVVKVEDETFRSSAKLAKLPGWQQLALKDHSVVIAHRPELKEAAEQTRSQGLDRQRPTGTRQRRLEVADPIAATDVISRLDQCECLHPVLPDGEQLFRPDRPCAGDVIRIPTHDQTGFPSGWQADLLSLPSLLSNDRPGLVRELDRLERFPGGLKVMTPGADVRPRTIQGGVPRSSQDAR